MLVADEVDSAGNGVLMLHLLGRCNLRCDHCYMDGAPERTEALQVDDVVAAITGCAELGFGSLYITGGEPLLYAGLDRVLEAAAALSGVKTTLCSNGTRLTPHRARQLADLGITLNVSLDGEPAYHDAFRHRRGAFFAAERGIGLAVAAGVPVTVIATITSHNLDMLPWLFERAVALGATIFRAQPLLDLGRGSNIADARLDPAQLDTMILQLTDLANRHKDQIRCTIIGQSRRYLQVHPCAAYVCNGGGCHRRVERELKKLIVREDGTVLPESTNLDPRYSLGRLGDAPIAELVARYLDDGYDRFDRLCRAAYDELIATWPMAIVPWDQIIAARSRSEVVPPAARAVGPCGAARGLVAAMAVP